MKQSNERDSLKSIHESYELNYSRYHLTGYFSVFRGPPAAVIRQGTIVYRSERRRRREINVYRVKQKRRLSLAERHQSEYRKQERMRIRYSRHLDVNLT